MRKKLLALLCAVTLLLGLSMSALAAVIDYGAELNPNEKVYSQTFHDVPENHWCFKMIEDLVERGAINGYPDGNFYPNNIVTRQEFAKIMVVAAKEPVYPAANVSFSDVPLSHWANPFIEAAKPYMTAYQDRQGNQTFKPEAGALREDMAVAVVKLRGYDARLADLSMLTTMFSDVDSISVSARPYVALAVENGIISGYPGQNGQKGTFGAQRTITRCEAAAILWRAFQYGSDEKVIPGDQPDQSAASDPVNTPEPTEPAQPSPSPKPTLPAEPTEPEKPYVAETLARANVSTMYNGTRFLHITMDDNDHVIYYDSGKEQIISLDPNTKKTSALLHAKTAQCEKDGVTYTDPSVDQVFWDSVAQRLLVLGTLEAIATQTDDDGWEASNDNAPETLSGIFTVSDGELEYTYQLPPSRNYDPTYLICALQNGNFVCGEIEDDGLNHEYFDNVYISDLEGHSQLTLISGYSYDGVIVQAGQNLYRTWKKDSEDSVHWEKYDFNSGEWDHPYSGYGSPSTWGYMAAYRNGLLYLWDDVGIRAIRPKDFAKQNKLDPTEDVEVMDMTSVPATYTFNAWYDRLLVTSDEQFVFYDKSAKAFRVIRENPDAEI